VNALELSHNGCYSSTAVSVPSKLVRSHAVCYHAKWDSKMGAQKT